MDVHVSSRVGYRSSLSPARLRLSPDGQSDMLQRGNRNLATAGSALPRMQGHLVDGGSPSGELMRIVEKIEKSRRYVARDGLRLFDIRTNVIWRRDVPLFWTMGNYAQLGQQANFCLCPPSYFVFASTAQFAAGSGSSVDKLFGQRVAITYQLLSSFR